MRNELFIKACYAASALPKFRIVKHGNADAVAALAIAGTDACFGVTDSLGANGPNDPVDIIRGGIASVTYGGTVTRGDPLTAGADGKAVKAATGQRVLGFAEQSGVANDVGSVFISPHVAGTIA